MQNRRIRKILIAIVTILIGVLFIFGDRGQLLNWLVTGAAICLLITAIADLIQGFVPLFVVKVVIGVAMILLSWLVVQVVLYVIAILLILYGILGILQVLVSPIPGGWRKILAIISPILTLAIGICLFFNQGAAINWVFLVGGILLILDGIFSLVSAVAE